MLLRKLLFSHKKLISKQNSSLLNKYCYFGQQLTHLCSNASSLPLTDSSVEDKPEFPGSRSKWSHSLEFILPETYDGIPVYRVMSRDGVVINPTQDPNLSQEMITKIYKGFKTY